MSNSLGQLLVFSGLLSTAALSLHAQAPAAQPAPDGIVNGIGVYMHATFNVDKTLAFYQEAFGFKPNSATPKFAESAYIRDLLNEPPGFLHRFVRMNVPSLGRAYPISFTEYGNVERKTIKQNPWDPGVASWVLEVRDLDATFEIVKKLGAEVIAKSGKPITMADGSRRVMVRDLDGFLLELAQASPAEIAQAPTGGSVVTTQIAVSVSDAAKSAAFYRDRFGFDLKVTAPGENPAAMDLIGKTGKGGVKIAAGRVPGSNTEIHFRQYTVPSQRLVIDSRDPGAAMVAFSSKDVNGLLAALKGAGVKVVSTGGVPSNNNVVVEDPDGLKIELVVAAAR